MVALQEFGSNLDGYLHMLLPPIIKVIDSSEYEMKIREDALSTIDVLSDSLDITAFAQMLVQKLVPIIADVPELRDPSMNLLSSLVAQMGRRYIIFAPTVQQVISHELIGLIS